MSAGTSLALAVVRVPRGAAQPTRDQLRAALDDDRRSLHLPPGDPRNALIIAGPFAVTVGDQSFDEYTVWER
ncbi:MAG TPA: hypothetical protein VL403_15105 [Candidatus Kryptonia bacterium]|nr:hypothetical protein [Candidatus Kryptonia bacterium]